MANLLINQTFSDDGGHARPPSGYAPDLSSLLLSRLVCRYVDATASEASAAAELAAERKWPSTGN